jgi:tRNA-dihydrouridine synthase A
VLKGLSPKENREVPPLRYDVVSQLAKDFPKLTFVLNGGLTTVAQCLSSLPPGGRVPGRAGEGVCAQSEINTLEHPLPNPPPQGEGTAHGIMLGRAAYHDSYLLAKVETALYGTALISREAVVEKMITYTREQIATTQTHRHPTRVRDIARHMLGLFAGEVGGKAWRRMLSDPKLLNENDPELLRRAMPFKSDYDDHRQPLLDALAG